MGKKILFILLLLGAVPLLGDCPVVMESFNEDFWDTTYKDPASSVQHWGEGYITMRFLGAIFEIQTPAYFPSWINSVAAGDFDEDGWVDFLGTSSSYLDVAFVRNLGVNDSIGYFRITHYIYGGDDDNNGIPDHPTSGHVTITSGDYNGDGHLDAFLVKARGEGTIMYVWLFIGFGNGYFQRYDVFNIYASQLEGLRWSATCMKSYDIDNDGDIDIIFGNRYGRILLLQNDGNANFTVQTIIQTPWGDRGVSAVTLIDYDGDGDKDILAGSVSYPHLYLYRNDGLANFTLVDTIGDTDGNYDWNDDEYDGAATVLLSADFDGDGDEDFVVGTDNWNWPGNHIIGGKTFIYRNNGDGTFQGKLVYNRGCGTPQGCNFVYDFDLGDVLDLDNDGDIDFFMADGNHSQRYYLFVNTTADIYNLQGTALSLKIPDLSPEDYSVVSIEVQNLHENVPQGTWVEYFVTNDGGNHWEKLVEDELYNGVMHSFKHFGTDFRWKAVMHAEDDNPPVYGSGSYETPIIYNIGFNYYYVTLGKYSRTSQVVGFIDTDGDSIDEEYLYSSYFHFPGFRGYLTAWDVSNLALDTTSTALTTLDESVGAEFLWDAGELLNARYYDSRDIYAAIPQGSGFELVPFNTQHLSDFEEYLVIPHNEAPILVNFVRGEGRSYKLLDINHSTPAFVGPPDGGFPLYSDPSYANFSESMRDRTPVLYTGTNGGMIHAFDAVTGEELWAIIPHNLLPKLKRMMKKDSLSEFYYYNFEEHPEFVDAPPVVKDVKFSDGTWHTVLIVGQGPGWGIHNENYYIAVDVTDPTNPSYLWEFTHKIGSRRTTGATWSVPEIYRIKIDDEDVWAVFVGSGYDNDNDSANYEGNVFYIINVENGELIKYFEVPDSTWSTGVNLKNAIPGSPDVVDVNEDGYADYIYFGDLDGNLWRVDVRADDPDDWEIRLVYKDPIHAPIFTKPAHEVVGSSVYVFFGTGGDDEAPNDYVYGFYALKDLLNDSATIVWYYGDPDYESYPGFEPNSYRGSLNEGEKVWADPVYYSHTLFFATLIGSIESVNPCENLEGGSSRLYVVNARTGETILHDAEGNPIPYLITAQKVRSAVTLGGRQGEQKKVYVQNFANPSSPSSAPTQQVLTVPISGRKLIIRSWREVF